MFNRPITFQPFFDATSAGGGTDGGQAGGDNSAGEGETLTFEAWSETLTGDQKGLIETHVKGLKSALDSERESRKGLEKQLRALATKSEKGSEAEKQLTKLADDLDAADRKADFYEAAHAAGVRNLKLAFTVAVNDEMFDKHGRVNFDAMKKEYPELFGAVTTESGDAGSGTNNSNLKKSGSMNDFIRTAAGR